MHCLLGYEVEKQFFSCVCKILPCRARIFLHMSIPMYSWRSRCYQGEPEIVDSVIHIAVQFQFCLVCILGLEISTSRQWMAKMLQLGNLNIIKSWVFQVSLYCVETGGQTNAFARECIPDKMQYSCSELTGFF